MKAIKTDTDTGTDKNTFNICLTAISKKTEKSAAKV